MRVLLERRSATELRRIVRDALASLHEALAFPHHDSLNERARHLIGVQHFATLALAAASARDWRASASHLLHALASERQLLGEGGPLRTALARERMVGRDPPARGQQ